MAEYIEREALLKNNRWLALSANDIAMAKSIILGQPAADVVEVRHGAWIDWHMVKTDRRAKEYPSVRCTNCGIIFCDLINNHNYMYRYCPHCGAKMDGKGEGE